MLTTIRQGSSGQDVVTWQKYLGVAADGKFGPATKKATVAKQKSLGVTADGVVGPQTWAAAGIGGASPGTAPGSGGGPVAPPPPLGLPGQGTVPMKTTPVSSAQVAAAFIPAYKKIFGEDAGPVAGPMLLSLAWIETARGTSMQNYNVGNITAGKTYSGAKWEPPWVNVTDASSARNKALHEQMVKGLAPSAFRSYPTLDAGMEDFLRQLKSTFQEVIAAAKTGDPDKFRVALSRKYSGDYKNTKSTATFVQLQKDFVSFFKSTPGMIAAGSAGLILLAGAVVVGLVLWKVYGGKKNDDNR